MQLQTQMKQLWVERWPKKSGRLSVFCFPITQIRWSRKNKDVSTPLTVILRQRPAVVKKILDSGLRPHVFREHGVETVVGVQFDWRRALFTEGYIRALRKAGGVETEFVAKLTEYGRHGLLDHPLVEAFAELKWSKVCHYFRLYFMLYVILFIYFLCCVSFLPYSLRLVGSLPLLAFMLVEEIVQWLKFVKGGSRRYVKDPENWIQLTTIAVLLGHIFASKEKSQPLAAFSAVFASFELMLLFGKVHQPAGKYVHMFLTVSLNFAKVFLIFGIQLLTFAFCFSILFENVSGFQNFRDAVLSTIVLATGEMEYNGGLFYREVPAQYSGYAKFIFGLFVLLVPVIMMNLLIGLAVADISKLSKSAEIDQLQRRIEFIHDFEVVSNQLRLKFPFLKNWFFNQQVTPLLIPPFVSPIRWSLIANADNQEKMEFVELDADNWTYHECFANSSTRLSREILERAGEKLEEKKSTNHLSEVRSHLNVKLLFQIIREYCKSNYYQEGGCFPSGSQASGRALTSNKGDAWYLTRSQERSTVTSKCERCRVLSSNGIMVKT